MPLKQRKQIFLNIVKNSNWQEADQLVIYNVWVTKIWTQDYRRETNPASDKVEALNLSLACEVPVSSPVNAYFQYQVNSIWAYGFVYKLMRLDSSSPRWKNFVFSAHIPLFRPEFVNIKAEVVLAATLSKKITRSK